VKPKTATEQPTTTATTTNNLHSKLQLRRQRGGKRAEGEEAKEKNSMKAVEGSPNGWKG